ncbi:MAG: C40 family peptidase, partial [Myxococcales bacterium]|nr:C40 family peptidase [Myxococcales bacterium]
SLDLAFDRNLCSVIREQEPVQVLMRWSDDLLLARSGYVLGWIPADAALSPVLAPREREPFVRGPWRSATRDTDLRTAAGEVVRLPFASRAPVVSGGRGELLAATERGVVRVSPADPEALAPTNRPLTRRQFLTDAFRYLGRSYGWGGYQEGRDCSRFLLDLFAGFGVELPRHSSDQAIAGEVIEVPPNLPERERMEAIDQAHRRGLVLLHFPNHIMLYLGRDASGVPMALHSFAEYLVPCAGRKADMPAGERETLYTVDKIQVSDLELGRGSSRTSFIERITKITVVGRRPAEAT